MLHITRNRSNICALLHTIAGNKVDPYCCRLLFWLPGSCLLACYCCTVTTVQIYCLCYYSLISYHGIQINNSTDLLCTVHRRQPLRARPLQRGRWTISLLVGSRLQPFKFIHKNDHLLFKLSLHLTFVMTLCYPLLVLVVPSLQLPGHQQQSAVGTPFRF